MYLPNIQSIRKLFILFIFLYLATPFRRPIASSSTDIYLTWEVEKPSALGYMTITNFPEKIIFGQTYKVDIKISLEELEWGDSVEFRLIHWLVNNNKTQMILGYSAMDTNITEHNAVNLVSHWSIPSKKFENGWLEMNTTIFIHNSSQPSESREVSNVIISPKVKVPIKFESQIFLNIPQSTYKRTKKVIIEGTLVPSVADTAIEIVYTKPTGEKIISYAKTDNGGSFVENHIPDILGTWRVEASWSGSEIYCETSSEPITYRVDPQSPIPVVIISVVMIMVLVFPRAVRKRIPQQNLA
ncbi:MAG: hypothetical protein ACXACY_23805 [Candidatus Hodarchaeales archaeon]|jgi:hypothetical protein